MVKQNITIDELAGMVARGFGDMGERFDKLEKELRGEIVEVRTELKEEIGELRTELKEEIGELRTELKEEISELRVITQRIDTRTQNQVDAVYEDTTTLKTDVKETKEDIVLLKKHVGMTV